LSVFSSDHAPNRFDDVHGKKVAGEGAPFAVVPNGVPGLETRLPILFSEGVVKGRIDLQTFVALSATNPARLFGLHPRKGTIAIGADADIAIWDPERKVRIRNADLHHQVDYTVYEDVEVTGWPEITLSRGEVVCWNGEIVGKPGWHTEALVGRLRGHPESGRRLFWFEALSDEALGSGYAASSVLLAASFGEGFGLPLIEAARHRIPVLARNLPVFHEVAGEAVVYFDAANATELVRAISDWEIRAQQGRLPDVPTPTPLTWRQSTHQLLDVIKLDGRSATPGPDVCEDRTSGFHA